MLPVCCQSLTSLHKSDTGYISSNFSLSSPGTVQRSWQAITPHSHNHEQPGISSKYFLPPFISPFHYSMNLPTTTRTTNFLCCSRRTLFLQDRKFTIIHSTPRWLLLNTQTTPVMGASESMGPVILYPSNLQLRNTHYTLRFPLQLPK